MENNTGTQKTENINDRLRELRTRYAAAYARSVRTTGLWLLMRSILAVVTIALVATKIFTAAVLGQTVMGILVALGISYMLRRGIRVLAWLGLAGGAASLVLLVMNLGSYTAMAQQYPLLYLYIGVAVLDAVVQCAVNGLLLADSEYREFSRAMNEQSQG
nr:hypothetical protein [uncultured Gemmiger sp.]